MSRVLVVIHGTIFGGPHNQVVELAGPLAELGWETTAVVPSNEGNGADRLVEAGIDVVQIPLHRMRRSLDPMVQLAYLRNFGSEVARVREIIKSRSIDVVQVCGLLHLQGARAANRSCVPLVWQLLSTFAPMRLRRLVMPWVSRWADVVMTTGLKVAKEHPGATAFGERLIPFFPPVDLSRFRPDDGQRGRGRQVLRVPEGAFLVGTVGNFSRQKRHEFLVQASAKLLGESDAGQTHFRILGAAAPTNERYYKRDVVELADRLGLLANGRLAFVEPNQPIEDLLPALDVFVLTSEAEGISTALLEAMACGIPVVATDVGSTSEVVQDGLTGFLVPPGDPDAVAEKIKLLRDNSDLARRVGDGAREEAARVLGVEACAKTHVHAYEMAMEHADARGTTST